MSSAAPARTERNALFVLAHQDDECFLSTRIERELASGRGVFCAFLTDGAAKGVTSAVRDAESRRVLGRLGVPESNLLFLGSAHGIPDQGLPERLDAALQLLEAALAGHAVHRVYCFAYEGGHPDHDASHLVAVAFARRRHLLARTWHTSAYNGHGTPGKLFRVQAPLRRAVRHCQRRLPAALAVRHAFLCFRYTSQWRTWLGLFPEFFVKRALLRRETLQGVDLPALRARPHPGPLFYERFFGFPWERFRAAAEPFLERHLG